MGEAGLAGNKIMMLLLLLLLLLLPTRKMMLMIGESGSACDVKIARLCTVMQTAVLPAFMDQVACSWMVVNG